MSSANLARMRRILISAAGGAAGAPHHDKSFGDDTAESPKPDPDNPLLNKDLSPLVTKFTPEENRMLKQVSKTVKDNLGKTHAYFIWKQGASMPDAYFEQLEKECQKHSLTKIRIPHVLIDNHARQRSNRLAAVLMLCPELQTLDVSDTLIHDPGWREIGEALESCPKLQVLDVEHCRIASTQDSLSLIHI